MMKASFIKKELEFSFPARTSRGVLTKKSSWFVKIYLEHAPEIIGIGECAPIFGLSPEKEDEYETILADACSNIVYFENLLKEKLLPYPSIYFGIETALMDLFKTGKKIFFHSAFTEGKESIKINGLVWMNTIDTMYQQALEKHQSGFKCIKLKIGALNVQEEISLLKQLRIEFGHETTLRVDANGAFDYSTAVQVLNELKPLGIHSIEQPLKQSDEKYSDLCIENIIPIALDEELVGIYDPGKKEKLLQQIKPQYIILKPSLHGGLIGCRQWISLAEKQNIGWWMTSALESNVGLNAIAQFTHQTGNRNYHGLGTGKIYKNNIDSPLYVEGEELKFNPEQKWEEI